jgi:hypothetical protein
MSNPDWPDPKPPTAEQRAAAEDDAAVLHRAADTLSDSLNCMKSGRWRHVPPAPLTNFVHVISGELTGDERFTVAETYAGPATARYIAHLGPEVGWRIVDVLRGEARAAADGPGADGCVLDLARTIIGDHHV